MLECLKRFKTYLTIFFVSAVFVISFAGSYGSWDDEDNIEAQKNINNSNASVISTIQTKTFQPSQFVSQTNVINPRSQFGASDTITLAANPGPANNGGSPGWAIFLNLIAGPRDIVVIQMSTANTGTIGQNFTVEVFTRHGNALGGPVSSGPGSDTAGWTSIGSVPAVQGPVSSGVSELFNIPAIVVPALDTVGVAVKFTSVGPRYVGTGSPPLSTYNDTNIALISGESRSAPFTPTGSWFSSRDLTGVIRYIIGPITGIQNVNSGVLNDFNLGQNYPNPFNPATTISYNLAKSGFVNLKVFDVLGREVNTLVNEYQQAGLKEINFNAANLTTGIYFYSIKTEGFSDIKKMTLIK